MADDALQAEVERLKADTPPRYAPAVYRDLALDFYNANYFHRKEYTAKA